VESQVKLLCPDITDAEGKADEFMRQGPKTVIITLGHSGCYLKDSSFQEYLLASPYYGYYRSRRCFHCGIHWPELFGNLC